MEQKRRAGTASSPSSLLKQIRTYLFAFSIRLRAIAIRLEAIEAIATRLEAIAIRLEAIAGGLEAIAIRLGASFTMKGELSCVQLLEA